jgi:hypothetical protein
VPIRRTQKSLLFKLHAIRAISHTISSMEIVSTAVSFSGEIFRN